jgi:2-oxoglutarate ferredoxin oxidoreductase subunit gamma
MASPEQFDPLAIAPAVAVRLSGSGGQGLVLAGRLLAESALHDGLDVVQTNSYGPEARGGASRSEVVIGRGEIDVLHAAEVDVLICLNQASCDAYYKDLAPRGLLITDGELVEVVPTTRAFDVPMTSLARKEVGTPVVANVIALAVLCAVSRIVSREALEAAIRNRISKALLEFNLKAIDVGIATAAGILSRKSAKMRALWPDYGHLRGCLPDREEQVSIDRASNGVP